MLTIFDPSPKIKAGNEAKWLVNGFPATVILWTADEWAKLLTKPTDARQFPNGSWAVLQMD